MVLVLAPRVFLRVIRFSSLHKNLNSNSIGNSRPTGLSVEILLCVTTVKTKRANGNILELGSVSLYSNPSKFTDALNMLPWYCLLLPLSTKWVMAICLSKLEAGLALSPRGNLQQTHFPFKELRFVFITGSYPFSQTNFQDFSRISRTEIEFSRALKFTLNPFTSKISILIFLSVYHTFLIIVVQITSLLLDPTPYRRYHNYTFAFLWITRSSDRKRNDGLLEVYDNNNNNNFYFSTMVVKVLPLMGSCI